jgi:hypothetical protein
MAFRTEPCHREKQHIRFSVVHRVFSAALAVSRIEGYNVDAYRPVGEKDYSVIATAARRVHALKRRDRAADTSVVLS